MIKGSLDLTVPTGVGLVANSVYSSSVYKNLQLDSVTYPLMEFFSGTSVNKQLLVSHFVGITVLSKWEQENIIPAASRMYSTLVTEEGQDFVYLYDDIVPSITQILVVLL